MQRATTTFTTQTKIRAILFGHFARLETTARREFTLAAGVLRHVIAQVVFSQVPRSTTRTSQSIEAAPRIFTTGTIQRCLEGIAVWKWVAVHRTIGETTEGPRHDQKCVRPGSLFGIVGVVIKSVSGKQAACLVGIPLWLVVLGGVVYSEILKPRKTAPPPDHFAKDDLMIHARLRTLE